MIHLKYKWFSRFGVIPKKNKPNSWRLILDLSFPFDHSVNDGIFNGVEGFKASVPAHVVLLLLQSFTVFIHSSTSRTTATPCFGLHAAPVSLDSCAQANSLQVHPRTTQPHIYRSPTWKWTALLNLRCYICESNHPKRTNFAKDKPYE